jgi:uncharacterized protein YigE (DUF2233 family)
MRRKSLLLLVVCFILLATVASSFIPRHPPADNMISYIVDPKNQDLQFYWKDSSGNIFRSIQRLKEDLHHRHKKLLFAMNGGMFNTENSPVGLFIQQEVTITPMDTSDGKGNFYVKPNGVLYITSTNNAVICSTTEFKNDGGIKFATQSGPMLLINGAFHPAFKKGSANLNIRNGVGILPDRRLVFAMSKDPVNFYDFAGYFKSLGCKNALYLDGFVSRTYLPGKNWIQTDGNFGVIIGVVSEE